MFNISSIVISVHSRKFCEPDNPAIFRGKSALQFAALVDRQRVPLANATDV
jgi:hypothetical protein